MWSGREREIEGESGVEDFSPESWCMAPQLKKQRNKSSFIPRGSPPSLSVSLSVSVSAFLGPGLKMLP